MIRPPVRGPYGTSFDSTLESAAVNNRILVDRMIARVSAAFCEFLLNFANRFFKNYLRYFHSEVAHDTPRLKIAFHDVNIALGARLE